MIVNQDPNNTGVANFDSLAGVTIGRINRIVVAQSDCNGLSFGHLILGNSTSAFGNFISPTLGNGLGTRAFTGEPVGWRMFRLAAEENVELLYYGTIDDNLPMGAQRIAPFMDLLGDAQAVDNGLLYAEKAGNGVESLVTYRTCRDMYNQYPRFIVDVTGVAATSQLVGSLKPVRNDQNRRNDITITRNGGSSAQYTIPDGDMQHLSTQDPPLGMGPVDATDTVQLYLDAHARLVAAWRAHLGSWRGPRFPSISLDMWRDAVIADTALVAGVKALTLGDMIQVNTTSALSKWVPRNDFSLMVRGYQVTKAQMQSTIKYNTIPGEAWEIVATDTNTSTLTLGVNSSATDLYVDMSSGPAWKLINILDTGYYVQINGDICKATDVTPELTPTFVSAGTVTHGNNASITPGAPAGAANGDALILMAAIRNSGTGTVDLPTGWTAIAESGNFRIMGRYRTGVAADTPTVTFTGGVANADTSAVILAFRNLSIRATGTPLTQLNGSVQDIAYPALKRWNNGGTHRYTNDVVLVAGWKQDDWTSVAALAGFTEAVDASTITGNDQGFVIDYRIDTALTEVTAGSLVVTGGAAAISRSIVVALRPLGLIKVTRNINNSAIAHVTGDKVRGWRNGVTGL